MLSELKEFLTRLLPKQAVEAFGKRLFRRNRVPPEAKAFACYAYVSQGSSFRKLRELLCELGMKINHVSIWRWLQRLGTSIKARLFRRRKRPLLVVDETKIRTRSGQIFIFVALDPENREIVNLLVTKWRGLMDTLGFLRRTLRFCDGKPIIATDGGPWYRWPTQRLGLKHTVLCGGKRSYIERWFKTLKNRLSTFDRYFPTSRLETVENFAVAFCFWYNECRKHMSLGGPPAGGEGGLGAWLKC